jgi:hypothetical protein
MNTIKTEPTFAFLTKKIKAGEEFKFNLITFMHELGYSPEKIEEYQDYIYHNGEKIAIYLFMLTELTLNSAEVELLTQELNPEIVSYIYQKLYENVRLDSNNISEMLSTIEKTPKDLTDIKEIYREFGV